MKAILSINNYGNKSFEKHFLPILNKFFSDLRNAGDKDGADIIFGYWVSLFYRNSLVLFDNCSKALFLSQSLFTIRLLLEIAADVSFISKYPENIKSFKKIHSSFDEKDFDPEIMHLEIKKYKICKYRADGEIKTTSSRDRIQAAFGTDTLNKYDYLCGFTHLNYQGCLMDINYSMEGNIGSFELLLPCLKLYSQAFTVMVKSVGKLCNISSFGEFDEQKINKLIEATISEIHEKLITEATTRG